MQRDQVGLERITLKRDIPWVPCNYSLHRQARWRLEIDSCGARIPFKPRGRCPSCGQPQINAHAPPPSPASRVIERDTAIVDADTGEVVCVYVVCATELASKLAGDFKTVLFDDAPYNRQSTTARLSGLTVNAATFGYAPPVPMRRKWGCSRSQLNSRNPDCAEHLAEFCRLAEHVFRVQARDVHDRTAQAVRDVIPPAWLIAGTPWSSGIINKTCALPYHMDRANVPSSWSAMIGCRRAVTGGLLHLADYDTYLTVAHGSITIFDGQSVTHGVTPLVREHPGGWRYTAVTYAKSEMARCCPDPAEEAARAARAATAGAEAKRGAKKAADPRVGGRSRPGH